MNNVVGLFPSAASAASAAPAAPAPTTEKVQYRASALAEAAAELTRQAAELAAGRATTIHPDWVDIVEGYLIEWRLLHPEEFAAD